MKTIIKLFSAVAALSALVSCSIKEDYNNVAFASVDYDSKKVEETTDGTTVTLPVHVYNVNSDCTVAYDVVDITAKQGVDYTVSGNGVLNFPAGTEVQNIEINIKGQPGLYTGDTKFQIVLKSATNNVTIGSYNSCTFAIVDKDHPLISLFGTYTYKSLQLDKDTHSPTYFGWTTMNISQYEGDPTKVWIDKLFVLQLWYGSYLTPGVGKCYANVSSDLKTISIPVPQNFNTSPVDLFGVPGDFWIYKCDFLTFSTAESEIVFTLQEDGSYKTEDDFGLNVPGMTGDWFYYGLNAFATYDPSKPTYFKKNE